MGFAYIYSLISYFGLSRNQNDDPAILNYLDPNDANTKIFVFKNLLISIIYVKVIEMEKLFSLSILGFILVAGCSSNNLATLPESNTVVQSQSNDSKTILY